MGLARALHNGQGSLVTHVTSTPGQLRDALASVSAGAGPPTSIVVDSAGISREGEPEQQKPDLPLTFIEVKLRKDDCSQELLEFGARVAAANSRVDTKPPVCRALG